MPLSDALSDFLTNGDQVVLCLHKAATKSFANLASENVWVINGNKHYFTEHLLKPRMQQRIKLKTKTFGLVYHTEGSEYGCRVFQVKRYCVESDFIVMKTTSEGETEVYVDNEKIVPTDVTTYDERKIKGVESKVSKIGFYIKEFKNNLQSRIFGGTNIILLNVFRLFFNRWNPGEPGRECSF